MDSKWEPTPIEKLVKIFREFPFNVKIEWALSDPGLAVIDIQFPQLTREPIPGICKGDSEVMAFTYLIDTFELLRKDSNPYPTVNGKWINGVLSPTMRSLFCHSLSQGEYMHDSDFAYAEYILEYYFQYVTMYPHVKSIEFEGENYFEQKGLNVSEETRIELLSCFHIQKTRELHDKFGIEAVRWMNSIRAELNFPKPVENEKKLSTMQKSIAAIKAEARILRESMSTITQNKTNE